MRTCGRALLVVAFLGLSPGCRRDGLPPQRATDPEAAMTVEERKAHRASVLALLRVESTVEECSDEGGTHARASAAVSAV